MMQSDGQATTLSGSGGDIFGGPARVMGIYILASATAGSVVVKDGGSGGSTVATFSTPASATQNVYIDLSNSPLRCSTSAYAALTNVTSATVIYA